MFNNVHLSSHTIVVLNAIKKNSCVKCVAHVKTFSAAFAYTSGFQTSEFVNLLNFCFGNGKLEYDNIKHIGKTMHKKETAATWCLLQTVQALASTLPASEQNREKGCAMILSLGSATSGSVSLHTIC